MVRSVVIEDSLKQEIEALPDTENSCAILIGSVQDDKRFILAIYPVPEQAGDLEKDVESGVNSLLFALPGGCYPLGVIAKNKMFALSSIIKKVLGKLEVFVRIDEKVSETLFLQRAGSKIEGKVMVEGSLKPITVKYMNFISQWNEVCTYTTLVHHLDLSERWRSNIQSYIKVLRQAQLMQGGHKLKGDGEFLDDPGKGKNSQGKVLHPKLLVPLMKHERNGRSYGCCYGELYTHLWVHNKYSIQQTRDTILEDLVKSLISRVKVFSKLEDAHYYNSKIQGVDDLKLPYRVTFPLGVIELSVYMLQEETLSNAGEVVKDMFELCPTNLKAHEECKEFEQVVEQADDEDEEEGDDKVKNVVLGALGGVLAILVGTLAISQAYQ